MLNQEEQLDKTKELDSEALDVKTIELVEKHFKEALKYREGYEEEWKECEDFYQGKHWKDKNRSFKNLVFPLVEQEIAVLMDSLPSTDVLARKTDREEDAKTLEASVHFTYEQQNLFLKLMMALRSTIISTTAFHYVDFDPDADDGQGLTTIKNIPWRHVYLDPAASDIDEASFVGIKFPVRIEEAQRKFPKFKNKIKASGQESMELSGNATGMKEDKHNYAKHSSGAPEEKYKLDGMCEL